MLDQQVLAQLRDLQSEDDPDLLTRVLSLYLLESPKLMLKMQQAAQDYNPLEIERSSHSLKSSSGNIGATELTRLCSEIHAAARASHVSLARDLLPKVEKEFERVLIALRAEIGPGRSAPVPA